MYRYVRKLPLWSLERAHVAAPGLPTADPPLSGGGVCWVGPFLPSAAPGAGLAPLQDLHGPGGAPARRHSFSGPGWGSRAPWETEAAYRATGAWCLVCCDHKAPHTGHLEEAGPISLALLSGSFPQALTGEDALGCEGLPGFEHAMRPSRLVFQRLVVDTGSFARVCGKVGLAQKVCAQGEK